MTWDWIFSALTTVLLMDSFYTIEWGHGQGDQLDKDLKYFVNSGSRGV